jgi:hypothetical protein
MAKSDEINAAIQTGAFRAATKRRYHSHSNPLRINTPGQTVTETIQGISFILSMFRENPPTKYEIGFLSWHVGLNPMGNIWVNDPEFDRGWNDAFLQAVNPVKVEPHNFPEKGI